MAPSSALSSSPVDHQSRGIEWTLARMEQLRQEAKQHQDALERIRLEYRMHNDALVEATMKLR